MLLVVVVVGGVVGGTVASDFGDRPAELSVEATDEHQSNATDVAFEVRATINNSAGTEVTETIALVVSGENTPKYTATERTVTVPANGVTTVTFTVPTGTLTSGTYGYGLVASDRAEPLASGNVTLDPPRFSIADTRASPVLHGADATVAATVHNRGDFRGMRTVRLLVDRNQDDAFDSDETIATRAPLLPPGGETDVAFTFGTADLSSGTYAYRVAGAESSATGTLTVNQPATFRIDETTMTTDLVRGEQFNASVTLVNEGDVFGSAQVRLDGPPGMDRNRSVMLTGGESTTLAFTAETANLTRGNYSLALSVTNSSREGTLRIRESRFEPLDTSGPETADVGEDLTFTTTLRNTGDAIANQTVELRFDLDGDDVPETLVGNRTVRLAPGQETTVEFTVATDGNARFDGDLDGTYIYGIYSEDANVTDVVVVRDDADWSGSSSGTTTDEPETVSLNVISQEKYGLYYEELSGETRSQIDELHQRQPFADGLVVTEVLTREEIARQRFGLDVNRNDDFEFTSIDIETQQEIEAAFDAQFQSDAGDRIDSWDELARQQYGSEYEALTDSEKQTIRERYQEQF